MERKEKINKYLKFGIISTVFVFSFLLFVNNSSATEYVPGDGLILYSDGTELSTGPLTTAAGFGSVLGTLSSVSVGTILPTWVTVKGSPRKKEVLAANWEGTNGKLELLRWAGTNGTWVLDWAENKVGSTSVDGRAYQIAYENSGEAVVAWAKMRGTTGGESGVSNSSDNAIEYKVWNGSTWTASTSFDLQFVTGSISWVQMWSHPASGSNQNDISLCYGSGRGLGGEATQGGMVGCLVWDGDSNTWGNEKLVESNAEDAENVTTATNIVVGGAKVFAGFFEQGSGDFVAVSSYEAAGTNALYTTFASPSWTATASFAWLDQPVTIDCDPMPYVSGVTNNQAVCVTLDDAAEDNDGIEYDGNDATPWNTTSAFDATGLATSATGRLPNDSTWLVNGTNRVALMTWGETTTAVQGNTWDEGGAAYGTADNPDAIPSGTVDNLRYEINPAYKNKNILLVNSSAGDLQIYKASISGSATILWGTVREDVTKDNTALGLPVGAEFYNYASPTFTHFQWMNDTFALNSQDNAASISAEDIKASGSEALNINTVYRLRTQISNEGPASVSLDKFRLEFTKAGTSCDSPSAGWTWRRIPLSGDTASDDFNITLSGQFDDGASTSTSLLTSSVDPYFANGYGLESRATSGYQTMSGNHYTEIEWAIQPNANISSDDLTDTYCFRPGWITNDSVSPNTRASMSYEIIASASVQAASNPTFTQNVYQWRYNVDSATPGAAIVAENTSTEILTTQIPRLRLNITVGTAALSANAQAFKLKFSTSLSGPWTDVGSTNSFEIWKYYDNPSVAHATTISTLPLTGSDFGELYMASNSQDTNPNGASENQDIEYDFALDPTRAVAGTTYYFRVFEADNDPLTAQNNDPTIVISRIIPPGAGGGDGGSFGGTSGGGSAQGGGGSGSGGGASGGSGGSAGAFTYVQGNTALNDATGTTLGVSLTGVTAGNLIVIWVKHEGDGASATTISGSDGTTSLSPGNYIQHSGNQDLAGQFLYLLSANGGDKTYTITWGNTRPWRRVIVMEFSYTGTATLDTQNGSSGTGTALNSGNITTSGAGSLVLGSFGEYSPTTTSTELVNGSAADGKVTVSTLTSMWRKTFSSTFSNGAATATVGTSSDWIGGIIAFKTTIAGGSDSGGSGGGTSQSGGGSGGGGGGSPVIFDWWQWLSRWLIGR